MEENVKIKIQAVLMYLIITNIIINVILMNVLSNHVIIVVIKLIAHIMNKQIIDMLF